MYIKKFMSSRFFTILCLLTFVTELQLAGVVHFISTLWGQIIFVSIKMMWYLHYHLIHTLLSPIVITSWPTLLAYLLTSINIVYIFLQSNKKVNAMGLQCHPLSCNEISEIVLVSNRGGMDVFLLHRPCCQWLLSQPWFQFPTNKHSCLDWYAWKRTL